jgi:outer membrane protein assembly factor BamB
MPSRRAVLHTVLATGLGSLAGCTDGDGTTPPATETQSSPPPGTSTPTAVPGEVRWRRSLDGAVAHRPVLVDGTLFVGTEQEAFAALSAPDGTRQWTVEIDTPIGGTPTVAGETVLVVGGETSLDKHHTLYALAAHDGAEQWRFEPNDWWLDVVGHDGERVFVASSDDARAADGQTLYARYLADGTDAWSVEVGDNHGGFVAGETVYVPTRTRLYAVGTSGRVDWTYEVPEYQFKTLSVAGETVALVDGEDLRQPEVHGLDAASGDTRFTFAPDWRVYTTHAAGDRLFVGGEKVARIDSGTGEREWVAEQEAPLYDAVVVDGTLYVAGRSAAALSVESGDVAWRTDLDAAFARPIDVAGGALLLHKSAGEDDRDRHLVALDRSNGDLLWEFAGETELTRPVVDESEVYVGEGSDVLAVPV